MFALFGILITFLFVVPCDGFVIASHEKPPAPGCNLTEFGTCSDCAAKRTEGVQYRALPITVGLLLFVVA